METVEAFMVIDLQRGAEMLSLLKWAGSRGLSNPSRITHYSPSIAETRPLPALSLSCTAPLLNHGQ